MDSKNFKMVIAYDGSDYLGWQDAKCGPSIEGALRIVLERIFQHPIKLQAASRTDAGVHARNQVVNFFSEKSISSLHKLQTSLNQLLPADIRIKNIEYADPTFHPTLDVISKEYHYEICYGPVQDPRHRRYSWHYHYFLDIPTMCQAIPFFTAEHDFAAFCNATKEGRHKTTVRQIYDLQIIEIAPQRLRIKIRGNNFLFRMVRNIAGTLVYIGQGKILSHYIPAILSQKKRANAGVTAPAHGLTLHDVYYE